jgi:plastocyanin
MRLLSMLVLSIAAANAEAQDCKEAYQVGKDIQDLRQQIEQIKTTLAAIQKAMGERVDVPEAPPSAEPPPATEAAKDGTVTGRVKFLEGSKTAYVFVENVGGRLARGRTVRINQRNKQFEPRHLVVQKGTTVEFPNDDGIYHNVFSSTPGSTFDLGIYRKGDAAKSYAFMQAGLIDVYCNMHAKMSAEILVVPNHLYAKVRPDGSFKLVRVPAGKRKIVAWAPGADMASAVVEVGAGPAALELSLAPRKAGAHLNKSGQPYGSYQ